MLHCETFFEHTADLGLRVRAGDLDTLFAEAARALFAAIVARYGLTLEALRFGTLAFLLLVVAGVDFAHGIIPNAITYPGILIGLALSAASGSGTSRMSRSSALPPTISPAVSCEAQPGGFIPSDFMIAVALSFTACAFAIAVV